MKEERLLPKCFQSNSTSKTSKIYSNKMIYTLRNKNNLRRPRLNSEDAEDSIWTCKRITLIKSYSLMISRKHKRLRNLWLKAREVLNVIWNKLWCLISTNGINKSKIIPLRKKWEERLELNLKKMKFNWRICLKLNISLDVLIYSMELLEPYYNLPSQRWQQLPTYLWFSVKYLMLELSPSFFHLPFLVMLSWKNVDLDNGSGEWLRFTF